MFKFSDRLIVIHIGLFHESLRKRETTCDGAITPELLRRINWTMVLAISLY